MIDQAQFIEEVLRVARDRGYTIDANKRSGEPQIDFGDKRLRAGHLAKLWPKILQPKTDIPALIESVAPGMRCTHEPMREIVEQLRTERRI